MSLNKERKFSLNPKKNPLRRRQRRRLPETTVLVERLANGKKTGQLQERDTYKREVFVPRCISFPRPKQLATAQALKAISTL